mmetsp:Transcript_24503/g.62867  ORF Transcript_24503/g.62867 Transcript_24503/m.62867 type:complete len:242 (+) Transcript_24503:377-1102(+)
MHRTGRAGPGGGRVGAGSACAAAWWPRCLSCPCWWPPYAAPTCAASATRRSNLRTRTRRRPMRRTSMASVASRLAAALPTTRARSPSLRRASFQRSPMPGYGWVTSCTWTAPPSTAPPTQTTPTAPATAPSWAARPRSALWATWTTRATRWCASWTRPPTRASWSTCARTTPPAARSCPPGLTPASAATPSSAPTTTTTRAGTTATAECRRSTPSRTCSWTRWGSPPGPRGARWCKVCRTR